MNQSNFFFLDTLDAPLVFWGFSFEHLTLYDMPVSLIDISRLLYAWMFILENFVGKFTFPRPLVNLYLRILLANSLALVLLWTHA